MTADIVVKSFSGDLERFKYCVRSIQKLALPAFRRLVLIVPASDVHAFQALTLPSGTYLVASKEPAWAEPYLTQQVQKLCAFLFTDANYILHVDSDCIFTKPVTPEMFMRDGKPIWYMTPYTSGLEVPWEQITAKFMQAPVEYEFMRRFPFLVPRFLHEAIAEFCQETHGTSLTDYILSQPGRSFSEFNALGALAYAKFRDKFYWIDTTKEEIPEPVLIQKWSHAPFTDADKAEFEEILRGSDNDELPNAHNSGIGSGHTIVSDLPVAPSQTEINPNIKQTKEGIWVLVNDTHISRWVEESGRLDHDQWLLSRILPEIPENGVVIEGGSFIGDHTTAFLKRAERVIAIEANPEAIECLRRNCPEATIVHGALGCRLTPPFGNDSWTLGIDRQNAGASRLVGYYEVASTDMIDIPVVTIDSLGLDRCDLISLDIEGSEIYALRGAEQTISRFHPKLILEINEGALQRQGSKRTDIWDWLHEHGYKPKMLQDGLTWTSPQFDVLCTYARAEHLAESCSTASGSAVTLQPDEDDAEIRALAEKLKGLMVNSVTTRRVRNILHSAGVIELPYRFRKRKGWKKRKAKA